MTATQPNKLNKILNPNQSTLPCLIPTSFLYGAQDQVLIQTFFTEVRKDVDLSQSVLVLTRERSRRCIESERDGCRS